MFCMCIEITWLATGESKFCIVCVLTGIALVQVRVIMFAMCIDRRYVGTGESKLSSLWVLTEWVLVQVRVCYVLYVY